MPVQIQKPSAMLMTPNTIIHTMCDWRSMNEATMRKIPSAMSIAPMTTVRAMAPDSGSAMMSKPTTMNRIPSRPCSRRHPSPALDVKTPTMLAMPAMTSSQPTMTVVTRVASIAL